MTIYCPFSEFNNMQLKIEDIGVDIARSELQRIPTTLKKISIEQATSVIKLLDLLEDNDDVQQVFHNMELTEEIMEIIQNE